MATHTSEIGLQAIPLQFGCGSDGSRGPETQRQYLAIWFKCTILALLDAMPPYFGLDVGLIYGAFGQEKLHFIEFLGVGFGHRPAPCDPLPP